MFMNKNITVLRKPDPSCHETETQKTFVIHSLTQIAKKKSEIVSFMCLFMSSLKFGAMKCPIKHVELRDIPAP